MALSYKARRRWSLIILLVGLPIYVVSAISLIAVLSGPPFYLNCLYTLLLAFYGPYRSSLFSRVLVKLIRAKIQNNFAYTLPLTSVSDLPYTLVVLRVVQFRNSLKLAAW